MNRHLGRRLLVLLGLLLVALPAGAEPTEPPPDVRTVVANVGNVSPHCAEQAFSLCLLPLEERVADGLGALAPDVVALIEVLPPDLCDGLTPNNPFNSCALEVQDPTQAERLLGPDFSIACGDRYAWDCLAVRTDVGAIEGCDGGYCGGILETRPVEEGCDDGFQIIVAHVTLHGHDLTIPVAHPDSMDVDCRSAALKDMFERVDEDREVLLLGDFNMDPYREDDASVEEWDRHVGEGRRFTYLSGIAEHDPPHYTLLPFESAQLDPTGSVPVNVELRDLAMARTIDHAAATEGLSGGCVTLGEAPGTERLEGPEGGLDHRALDCTVAFAAVAIDGPSTPAEGVLQQPPSPITAKLPATGGTQAPAAVVLLLAAAVAATGGPRSARGLRPAGTRPPRGEVADTST
jgi:hypothetical protein